VKEMENVKKTTEKQLAYVQHLRRTQGKESLDLKEDLGFEEASKMIEDLMGVKSNRGQTTKINEPRLGMAMKECYKMWRNCGRDIFPEQRETFKKDVIRTYRLFTEIAGELEQGNNKAGVEG
jgi:hypothetical protein